MKVITGRNFLDYPHIGFAIVLFLLSLLGANRALSQGTVSGVAVNESRWSNTVLTPPGDGSGTGTVRVGVWPGEAAIGTPVASTNVASTNGLPFEMAKVFPYEIGPLEKGDYVLVAWIDGSGTGELDLGEPRSINIPVTIETNDVPGVNSWIIDDINETGMSDWWEVHWFGDLNTADPDGDFDNDGLTDLEEYQIAMSDPSLIDLSPVNWDSSGDGMDDWWKWQHYAGGQGLHPCLDEADLDFDGDGLTNLQEYRGTDGIPRMEQDPNAEPGIGRLTGSENWLNPLDIDTSDDGFIDSFGLAWYDPAHGIDPLASIDPGADPDRDGLTNFREQCLHKPFRSGGIHDLWTKGPDSLPSPCDETGIRIFDPPLNLTNQTAGLTNLEQVVYALREHATWTRPSNDSGYDFDHEPGTYWNIGVRPGWDTAGDRLPDGWKVEFGLDPRDGDLFVPDGNGDWKPNPNSFLGDPDGDGLINMQEYLGQDGKRAEVDPYIHGSGDETNPNEYTWWPNLIDARPQRFPSIGFFLRRHRQHAGGIVAGPLPAGSLGRDSGHDTDNNGIPDHVEIQQGTSPVHSMDPFLMRSARIIDADGIALPDPSGNEYSGYRPDLVTRAWTLECYVKIDATGRSGNLIELPGPIDGHGTNVSFTARLALSNDVPLVAFQTIGGEEYQVKGLPLPTGRWMHVAGVWDPENNSLTLYVDGIFAQSLRVFEECVSTFHYAMRSPPRLGSSHGGEGEFSDVVRIDEVRIWGVARPAEKIEQYRRDLVNPYQAAGDLLAYFRFDDGGLGAEDFMRRARSSLKGAGDYLFADQGYALPAGVGFEFDHDEYATVYGVDARGADDSSGDGLPDPWKLVNHLDVFSAEGEDGRDGDPDGDGLSNIYEYWARTNPRASDTSGNGIPDAWEDLDGDGVPNLIEQQYGTRPDMVDTANSGFTDGEEIDMGTDPTNPLDPLISRCMRFGGNAGDFLEIPIQAKQRLSTWTLEAWVRPETNTAGTVIRRTVQRLPDGRFAANWLLGVKPDTAELVTAYAGFIANNGNEHVVSSAPFPVGEWTHLAASYDTVNTELKIFVNGVLEAETRAATGSYPINGKVGENFVHIGESFHGDIDEVRVWNTVRGGDELQAHFDRHLEIGMEGLVHHFRFDDGQANENVVPFGEFHQPYGPQDFTHPEDWHNQWRHAGVMHGNVAFAEPGAIATTPSLRVILEPGEAALAGARWRIDGEIWHEGGTVVSDLEPGLYEVEFLSVEPWQAPDPIQIELTEIGMTTVTGLFTHITGIRIFIQPPEAQSAGAAWRFAGSTEWHQSGQLVPADPGARDIEFRALDGWASPEFFETTIVAGAINAYTRYYHLLDVIGSSGEALPGRFRFPRGLALDADRNLYVADSGNHRVQIRDPISGNWSILGDRGQKPGQFEQPFGVTIDSLGRVYIADANNHRIQRYDPSTTTWTVWGGTDPGDDPGRFNVPYDVAVDAATNVYVADYYNHRIQKRLADGKWTVLIDSGFDAETQTRLPAGIAVDGDSLTVADHGAETGVSRVRRFDIHGNYIETLPGMADGIAINKPRSPFAASADSLLIADMVNDRILRFCQTAGQWDTLLGATTLNEPEGVAMDLPGFVYISDTANHRLLRLGLSGYSGQAITPFSTVVPTPATAAADEGGGMVLRWRGKTNWFYFIQFRDNLRNGSEWEVLPGAERVPGKDGMTEFIDPDPTPPPSRYYRIQAY